MVAANVEKATVMQDQAALQLFSILGDSVMSDMARECLQLRREEELTKVKRRIQLTKDLLFLEPIVVTSVPNAAAGASRGVAGESGRSGPAAGTTPITASRSGA